MKSIKAVERVLEGNVSLSSTEIEMEQAIMNENAARFKLACRSPMFHADMLKK